MLDANRKRIGLVRAAALILMSGAAAGDVEGQISELMQRCERNDGDQVAACAVTETMLAARSDLAVRAQPNGGVTITGWDRNEIQVRATIRAFGDTDAEAQQILSAVGIETANGVIRATGPRLVNRRGWSVGYEISVPRRMNLDVETVNGGIRVAAVEGTLLLNTTNGGIDLEDVGGNVLAVTTNGGVRARLATGGQASGPTVLRTTNGGISVGIPENFGAHLVASTTLGRVSTDFPIMVSGRIGRQIETDIGGGGPTLELSTTNGSIEIGRR